MTTRRVAGGFGVLFVLALLVGNGLTQLDGAPQPGAPAAEYEQWLGEQPPGAAFWAGAYVELLGLLAMLVFVVALSAVLRGPAGEWDWLPSLALGAGIASVAIKLASGPIAMAAYDRGAEGLGGDAIAALIEANAWAFVLSFAVNGLFLIAVGLALLVHEALPRWLAWIAIAFGVLGLLGPLGGLTGLPAILLFFLWVVAASGFLLARRRREGVAPP